VDQLPGTTQHQQILRIIREFYGRDNRVLAVILFGSLARGGWHERSDLDLDVVIQDDTWFDPPDALSRLCEEIENACELKSIRLFRPPDSGDVVLSNLLEFSIRYHPLVHTSPNIIDSMLLLTGELPLEAVRAAGTTNAWHVRAAPTAETLIDECIRYTLEIANAIERGNLWLAVELLTSTRGLLMQLFSLSRGGTRPLHHFQKHADAELQASFARLLPQLDKSSLEAALQEALTLLNTELFRLTASTYALNDVQKEILLKIRRLIEE
jgi:predicted nucleotidyltransferase